MRLGVGSRLRKRASMISLTDIKLTNFSDPRHLPSQSRLESFVASLKARKLPTVNNLRPIALQHAAGKLRRGFRSPGNEQYCADAVSPAPALAGSQEPLSTVALTSHPSLIFDFEVLDNL